jgi:hypothetical protein|tara:strand:- start:594 stop:857 length:264 start_codon:yes stop_codon:yes gene_type:complete
MLKKTINIFFITSFLIFIIIIIKYYFSEKNFIFTNKSRSFHYLNLNNYAKNLPLLKNNTNDIIIYKNDLAEFKNKRKKRVWEKLISN